MLLPSSSVNTKTNIMRKVCSINQAIKLFKGDLSRVKQYCKDKGISISEKALQARLKSL